MALRLHKSHDLEPTTVVENRTPGKKARRGTRGSNSEQRGPSPYAGQRRELFVLPGEVVNNGGATFLFFQALRAALQVDNDELASTVPQPMHTNTAIRVNPNDLGGDLERYETTWLTYLSSQRQVYQLLLSRHLRSVDGPLTEGQEFNPPYTVFPDRLVQAPDWGALSASERASRLRGDLQAQQRLANEGGDVPPTFGLHRGAFGLTSWRDEGAAAVLRLRHGGALRNFKFGTLEHNDQEHLGTGVMMNTTSLLLQALPATTRLGVYNAAFDLMALEMLNQRPRWRLGEQLDIVESERQLRYVVATLSATFWHWENRFATQRAIMGLRIEVGVPIDPDIFDRRLHDAYNDEFWVGWVVKRLSVAKLQELEGAWAAAAAAPATPATARAELPAEDAAVAGIAEGLGASVLENFSES